MYKCFGGCSGLLQKLVSVAYLFVERGLRGDEGSWCCWIRRCGKGCCNCMKEETRAVSRWKESLVRGRRLGSDVRGGNNKLKNVLAISVF